MRDSAMMLRAEEGFALPPAGTGLADTAVTQAEQADAQGLGNQIDTLPTSLEDALGPFSRRLGQQIIFSNDLAHTKRSPASAGHLRPTTPWASHAPRTYFAESRRFECQ